VVLVVVGENLLFTLRLEGADVADEGVDLLVDGQVVGAEGAVVALPAQQALPALSDVLVVSHHDVWLGVAVSLAVVKHRLLELKTEDRRQSVQFNHVYSTSFHQ
jgi:hypothetical protein